MTVSSLGWLLHQCWRFLSKIPTLWSIFPHLRHCSRTVSLLRHQSHIKRPKSDTSKSLIFTPVWTQKQYLTIEAMLIWKLFILAIAESATLRQILNLPTVKRGGSEPLYNYQFGRVLSLVNRKNDLASRLTVTKKIKMGQPLRNMLSVISPKPTHKSNRRRIPAKRSSSRFNHFRKYHSK